MKILLLLAALVFLTPEVYAQSMVAVHTGTCKSTGIIPNHTGKDEVPCVIYAEEGNDSRFFIATLDELNQELITIWEIAAETKAMRVVWSRSTI